MFCDAKLDYNLSEYQNRYWLRLRDLNEFPIKDVLFVEKWRGKFDSMKPGKILSRHPGQALDWLVKESSHSRVPSGTATGQALRFPQSVGRMARPLHEGGRHAARCTHPDTRLPPPQSRS